MKFLIDTGANKNYICPEHVNFENCKEEFGISVNNIKGSYKINKSASFDVFGIGKKVKFYVYRFHKFFDGLIGYETLRELKAQLNIRTNSLQVGRKTFSLKKKFSNDCKINLTEQEFQFINVKTKQNGDFVIEKEKHFNNYTILPGLYSSTNNTAYIAIQNHSKAELEININEIELENRDFEITKIPIEKDGSICKNDKTPLYTIRDEHMNQEEKKALTKIIGENSEVLYLDSDKLSFTHKIKHKIRTVDNIPIHTKSYRYPKIFEDEVQVQVKKMLEDGIIRESISPYTSPVWVVPKKTDASGKKKFRLVIDYRKLNEKTINDKYPIPEITDILDKLGRTNYFSTIDLVSGFHQIQLAEEDIEKTAFSVNSGKYEFTRMPFGLKNAPATFQRVMDCVLRDYLGKFCLVYMDDIIVFSPSLQEHTIHLRKVFNQLKEAHLKIQLDKCEFFKKEVQFLGHTVSEDGVRPNFDKIEIIKKWPIPKNEKQVRQFLGILGYYRRFIKDFAKLVKPLTKLLRKDSLFEITKEIVTCFEKCKQVLTADPVLIYPDFTKEFILTTDASDFAIGAVLSQGIIGKDRPIAFASRTLNKTEENYSATEKEFLAIVWAVKHFRPYLYGRKFKLYTDHQPLTYSLTNTNNRIVRGKLALEEFDYEIIYKPGKQNTVADALSRIKMTEINSNESKSQEESDDGATIHSADTSDDHFIHCTEKPINTFRNQIILKISPIETNIHEEIFPKYHRHIICRQRYTEEEVVHIFRDLLHPRGLNCIKAPITLIQLLQETYRKHFSRNKIFKILISEILLEDVLSEERQDAIIRETHTIAHRGQKENKLQILQKYFFPTIDKKLQIFVNSCDICKKSKYDRSPPKLIRKSTFGNSPFDRVHVDIFFMKATKWLTIVDSFSKFANTVPLQTRTIGDLKKAITEHIRQFGRPNTIICDQEPAFKSIDFIGFLNNLGIEVHYASNSNSNGIVERFHSTLIELYRTMRHKYNDMPLEDQINILTDLYNNTFHSVTKQKPRDVIFNTRCITNTEEIATNFNKIHSAIELELMKRKENYENKNKNNGLPKELQRDEKIYIKSSQRQTKDKDPFKTAIVKEDQFLTFKDNYDIKIHKNRIKT